MTNLRARQRQHTSDTIQRAAVDLVHEKGLENVTTEMISESAGISPRTFFNYFPYKEAALIPPKNDLCDAAIAEFLAAKGSLLDDLVVLITPMTEIWSQNRSMLNKLFQIADSHPKLAMLKISSASEHELGLRKILAQRLGQEETDYLPVLISAVVTTAIRISMERWAKGEESTTKDCVRRALTSIQTMFNDAPSPQ